VATSPHDLTVHRFVARDGVELAWRETGSGRPVVLIHGLFSDAFTNWIKFGHAARIAAAGFRVIMPDLRGHGNSSRSHDAADYPADVLASDGEDLIAHLRLAAFDLGGYSLGGRTVVRMLVRGAKPARPMPETITRAGLLDTAHRAAHFKHILDGIGTHPRGSPEWMAEAFLKTTGGDPKALRLLLDSFVDTPEAEIRKIRQPTLVIGGVDDDDNGPGAALAAILPNGRFDTVPGNHMSAVTRPELGRAIAGFLLDRGDPDT
jgi:pimeloyl-ACP methyl ester carboxylesterase